VLTWANSAFAGLLCQIIIPLWVIDKILGILKSFFILGAGGEISWT
jgi:hypothetical protein